MFSIIAQPNANNTQVNFDGSDFAVTATTEGWSVSNCPWMTPEEVFPFTEDSVLLLACNAAALGLELVSLEQVQSATISIVDGKKTYACEDMYDRVSRNMVNHYLPRIPQALRAIEALAKKEWTCAAVGETYVLSCEGVDETVVIQLESTPIGIHVKVDVPTHDIFKVRHILEDGNKPAVFDWLAENCGGMIAAIAGTPIRSSEMKRILEVIDVPTEYF